MRWEFTLEFKKKIYFSGRIQIALTQPLQIIAFHARAQRKLMIRLNAFLVENEWELSWKINICLELGFFQNSWSCLEITSSTIYLILLERKMPNLLLGFLHEYDA